jgi:hypothetical protein
VVIREFPFAAILVISTLNSIGKSSIAFIAEKRLTMWNVEMNLMSESSRKILRLVSSLKKPMRLLSS